MNKVRKCDDILGVIMVKFRILIFQASILYLANGQNVKTVDKCLTGGNIKVECVCDPGEMLHILSVRYQTASQDCLTVDGECQLLQESSDNGLYPNCNGKQICNETISDYKMKQKCDNFTAVYMTLSYECISGSTSVCDVRVASIRKNVLYLVSPGYLFEQRHQSKYSVCGCQVSGSKISIEILEVNFSFDLVYRANLTLTGTNNSWSSLTEFLIYNKYVLGEVDTLDVEFDSRGRGGQHMWVKAESPMDMEVNCNADRTPLPTVVTTTETNSLDEKRINDSSTGSVSLQHNGMSEGEIVAILCSVMFVMVVVAVALLVYLYRIRNNKPNEDTVSLQMDPIIPDNHSYSSAWLQTAEDGASRRPEYTELETSRGSEHHYIPITTRPEATEKNNAFETVPYPSPGSMSHDNEQSSC